MILKTKEYDKFKFRSDNRAVIDQAHVKKLVESIKSRNLLELRPISVSEDFEIIDGQHRLIAAKTLGVEIYYEINETLKPQDIILMNIAKSWTTADYLNYYCKNGFKEYQKLQNFMKTNNITLKIALNITMGQTHKRYEDFKKGNYEFADEVFSESLDLCWDTIKYIKKKNGFSSYTSSARFWQALLKLINHSDFNAEKWRQNLSRMIERFGPRATTGDYYKMMMEVYNWRNPTKIDLYEKKAI